jgi:hypothetical protein
MIAEKSVYRLRLGTEKVATKIGKKKVTMVLADGRTEEIIFGKL